MQALLIKGCNVWYVIKCKYKILNGQRYNLILFCLISSYRATQRLINCSTRDMYIYVVQNSLTTYPVTNLLHQLVTLKLIFFYNYKEKICVPWWSLSANLFLMSVSNAYTSCYKWSTINYYSISTSINFTLRCSLDAEWKKSKNGSGFCGDCKRWAGVNAKSEKKN